MEKKTLHLEELRNLALDFVTSSWQSIEVNKKYPVHNYDDIADKTFMDLIKGKTINPIMMRLAGQSGSGKSSQLLPAAIEGFNTMGIKPIQIMVRFFSKYHPFYKEIEAEYGQALIRENTNGFALMLLFLTLEKLIKQKFPILFEVTLLDTRFENYLYNLAIENGYSIDFHVMAVSKTQSDKWIEEREINSTTEKKRKVAKTSSDYFYSILPEALENLGIISKDDCFIWDGISSEPSFKGEINNPEVLKIFKELRQQDFKPRNVGELLNEKIKWFKNYYKNKYKKD